MDYFKYKELISYIRFRLKLDHSKTDRPYKKWLSDYCKLNNIPMCRKETETLHNVALLLYPDIVPKERPTIIFCKGLNSGFRSRCIQKTEEWANLREFVFLTYGKACMKCGSTDKIHVDHIKPVSKYPELSLSFRNLQVLCSSCNISKGNRHETDYRPKN
jgi:hypothetical protein